MHNSGKEARESILEIQVNPAIANHVPEPFVLVESFEGIKTVIAEASNPQWLGMLRWLISRTGTADQINQVQLSEKFAG